MRVPIVWTRCLVILAIAMSLYALAYSARRGIVEAQYRMYGPNLPFTLESALYYRRVKIVYDTGRLPRHDPMIEYPEGINPWTTYTAGSEYVYAVLARFFPSDVPFADRLRRIEAGWFSLAIPLLAWGLYRRFHSWSAALWGSSFYAVSISSVLRSTGLELSHENFAIPLLVAHWTFDAIAKTSKRSRNRIVAQIASAAALGLSLCTWDLIQYYIGLRTIWRIIRRFRGDSADVASVWAEYAALCAVAFFNPYHFAQGWGTSQVMALVHGLAISDFVERLLKPSNRGFSQKAMIARRALTLVAVWLAVQAMHAWFAPEGAYRHFGELLVAKIRFLNRKPADPSLLTFDQRIMWVPALNSVDWPFALMIFPALSVLTLLGVVLFYILRQKSPEFGTGEVVFAVLVSAVAFWLFARFHVFLALFACMLVSALWAMIPRTAPWGRLFAGILLGLGLLVESAHTMRTPERWGRVNVYYRELLELTTWLERHVSPEPVLANFGVSGAIAAYGKCAILLHPKFESAAIRQRVKEYGERLFLGTEKEFRDWADSLGARYYVHAFGEFSRQNPELQMRYFVNALDPRPDAAARGFEFAPEDRTWFVPLYRNVKYAVFRIVTSEDEYVARQNILKAERAFEQGDLAAARNAALAALETFPRNPRALELIAACASLEMKGFNPGGIAK